MDALIKMDPPPPILPKDGASSISSVKADVPTAKNPLEAGEKSGPASIPTHKGDIFSKASGKQDKNQFSSSSIFLNLRTSVIFLKVFTLSMVV